MRDVGCHHSRTVTWQTGVLGGPFGSGRSPPPQVWRLRMKRHTFATVLVTAAVLVGSAAAASPATTTTTTTTVKPAATVPAAPAKNLVQLSVGTSKTAADALVLKANTALKPTVFRILTDATPKNKKTQYHVASGCLTKADATALVKAAKAAGYAKAYSSTSKSCKA